MLDAICLVRVSCQPLFPRYTAGTLKSLVPVFRNLLPLPFASEMGGFILLPWPSKSFDRVESGSSFKGNCLAEVLTKKLFFENTNVASSC